MMIRQNFDDRRGRLFLSSPLSSDKQWSRSFLPPCCLIFQRWSGSRTLPCTLDDQRIKRACVEIHPSSIPFSGMEDFQRVSQRLHSHSAVWDASDQGKKRPVVRIPFHLTVPESETAIELRNTIRSMIWMSQRAIFGVRLRRRTTFYWCLQEEDE